MVALYVTQPVIAGTIGVGVGTGKIRPDEPLLPGITYAMPSVAVFNSGDVASTYEMSVQFNETQPEFKPQADWITFSPQKFTLDQGGSQEVKITVQPSSSAQPGSYFAYLEAQPTKKDVSGETAVKIAAATKLNFEVEPANWWQRIYYAVLDFWNKYQMVITWILVALGILAAAFLAKKYLKIEIRRK